jgi:GTP-binding protein EngB required for normal cell division
MPQPQFIEQPQNLLDILKALHDTGYENFTPQSSTLLIRFNFRIQHVMDLPQVVVIGSQSVGKSSLIESMSGVSVNFYRKVIP